MRELNINWFEVPALDVQRAAAFYAKVLGVAVIDMQGPEGSMKAFANGDVPVGAISPGAPRADGGVVVYFGTDDVDGALGRVRASGGKVVMEKTSIGPFGYIAQFLDTEGNRAALHCG